MDAELLIIDGGSTDGTLDVIRGQEPSIAYWRSARDAGVYDAWNKALGIARGEWLLFLGADDFLWSLDVLKIMKGELRSASENERLVYGQVARVDEHGDPVEILDVPWEVARIELRNRMAIPHPAVFYRRIGFESRGGFDPTFRIAGDYERVLREVLSGTARHVPIIVTGMQVGGLSARPQNAMLVSLEDRRAQLKNGVNVGTAVWFRRFTKALIVVVLFRLMGDVKARRILDLIRRVRGLPAYWTRG